MGKTLSHVNWIDKDLLRGAVYGARRMLDEYIQGAVLAWVKDHDNEEFMKACQIVIELSSDIAWGEKTLAEWPDQTRKKGG